MATPVPAAAAWTGGAALRLPVRAIRRDQVDRRPVRQACRCLRPVPRDPRRRRLTAAGHAMTYREGRRWERCPSWSKMHRTSAGPPRAPNACGIIVENSAAWPASTTMVRSPRTRTMVPDRTVNQSLPGWTRSSSGPAAGLRPGDPHLGHGDAVRPGLPAQHPGGHPPHHVALRPDHHIPVIGRLDQLVQRGAQRPGDRGPAGRGRSAGAPSRSGSGWTGSGNSGPPGRPGTSPVLRAAPGSAGGPGRRAQRLAS